MKSTQVGNGDLNKHFRKKGSSEKTGLKDAVVAQEQSPAPKPIQTAPQPKKPRQAIFTVGPPVQPPRFTRSSIR
jgi:hypothetical protein